MGQVDDRALEKRQRKARQNGVVNRQTDWKGFVAVDLTEQDKQTIRGMSDRFDQAWAWLIDCIFNGYKFGASYDHRNSAYVVTLTCWRSADKNIGLCLTARGGSFNAALLALWYKDTELLGGDWSKQRPAAARFEDEFDVG